MKIITFIILLLSAQVLCVDETTESVASGDGEETSSMMTSFTMIDDNGDIAPSSINGTDQQDYNPFADRIDSKEVTSSSNISTTETTMEPTETTTLLETTVTTTEAPTTTVPTTTTTTQATTTTTEPTTTTTSTTTTTMAPTTTTTMRTTTLELESTTTTSSPTTESTEPMQTKGPEVPQLPPVGTTFVPEPEAKSCTFIDNSLLCNEEIYCYGEGEIDCTEDAEMDPVTSAATFIEKISVSSISEDYSDYDGGIATFPPALVGVISPNRRIPFLFKMRSLGTTDVSDSSSSSDSTSTSTVMTTVPATEAIFTTETTVTMKADIETTTLSPGKELNDPVTPEGALDASNYTVSFSGPDTIPETTEYSSTPEETEATVADVMVATSTQEPITITEYVTSHSVPSTVQGEDLSAAIVEDSSEKTVNIRRKRDDNILSSGSESSSSSMSVSFHMAALESSKKKIRVKACRLTGNLKCNPSPTTSMCKGRTYCQVVSGTAETSEKSTSTKGVENWAIAVIAICAIAAALTISLLVYLVVTSWKKLKVQPQSGVTTLNYVNSTPP